MLHNRQRYIFFHSFRITVAPEKAATMPAPTMRELMSDLHKRLQDGACVHFMENDTSVVRLLEMDFSQDAQVVSLLVAYADKNASDPAFLNFLTGDHKVVTKGVDEGGAYSAHCVIWLDPLPGRVPQYRAILERVPSVTKSVVVPFLNSQIKAATPLQLDRKGERPIKAWPKLDVSSEATSTIREEVRDGVLKGVELVRYEYDDNGIDMLGQVQEVRQSILIKVGPDLQGDERITWLNKVAAWAKPLKFAEMKVKYTSRTGKDETVPVPTLKTDAGEFSFSRHEMVEVERPLAQFEPNIRGDLVKAIIAVGET